MTLPGGASGKIGIRYEGLWTVFCMIRVMQEEAEWIWLERAGEENEGFEFALGTPTGVEYHQVKRQKTGMGKWSLPVLSSEGVLTNFYQKLDDPSVTCVFVSAHAADVLEELANRARSANSWLEFNQAFISSDGWSTEFSSLHNRWNASDKEVSFQRLRRAYVHTIDEDLLRKLVSSRLEVLVSGNPENALDVLFKQGLDALYQKLDSQQIWRHLTSRGFSKQTWATDPMVADKIEELNQAYLAGIKPIGIGGEVIHRDEADEILAHFDAEGAKNVALLTGPAGVGKSSVISQVLSDVELRGWPMLTLRVDRLEPCRTPSEVGRQLQLPGSPASVLASMAGGEDCLLVIDQLDAISLASGRNPEFFDCIAALLEQAGNHPKMRVLSACRKFDVENDYRLRQLTSESGLAKEFPVGRFDGETVRRLVSKLGIDPNRLNPKQMELLSLPVHLRLLSECPQDRRQGSIDFRSAKDLYDRFWDYKQQKLARSYIEIGHVFSALDSMIDYMNKHETLSAPASLLDEHPGILPVMASENIIVKGGSRISFFHESFFDYMFARRMVSADFDLLLHLRRGDQGLFLRSLVRQYLLHQRDISPQDALRNIRGILDGDDIRVHLKSIVLALLGSLDDPIKEEWDVMEPLLDSDLYSLVWSSIYGSPTWFDLLDTNEYVGRWLANEATPQVDRAVWLLTGVRQARAARVAELLKPFINSEDPWPNRLSSVIFGSDIGASRDFFDFVLSAVQSGVLDNLLQPTDANGDAWHLVEPLVGTEPEWACELLAAYCTRLLWLAVQDGETNPFPDTVDRHRIGSQVLLDAAQTAPKKYSELFLPILVQILAINSDRTGAPPWPDMVWHSGIYGDLSGLDDNFLEAIVSAMRCLAQLEPDTFRRYAGVLGSFEFMSVRRLLARSYEANGELFADEAIECLLLLPNSLAVGDRSSHLWVTRNLLEATTAHCSLENLARLEQAVLDYYPEYELDHNYRVWRGHAQLTLLEGIQTSRLSRKGWRRLQELRRKFADRLPAEPKPLEGGRVGSPIPEESARKMSDRAWLRAMETHSSGSSTRSFTNPWAGGALELSRELEKLTKEDPARFANLIHDMPDDTDIVYFEAILKGINGSDLAPETVLGACLRCHRLPDRPLGRWITRPLEHLQDSQLPVEALEMVAWYATESDAPAAEFTIQRPGQTSTSHGEDLWIAGINSVRGAAADTIARLVFTSEKHLKFFEPYLRVMVDDDSLGVRTCVAHALLSVMRHDRDLAVELFLTLCETDDRLLVTHYVETFLKYAVKTHYEQMGPILSRMIDSEVEEVATAGARQVCLASLESDESMVLAARCASGSKALRAGMAEVYSANLKQSAFRSHCEEMLRLLFSDPDVEVRRAAGACFGRFEGHDAREFQGLIETYIQSPAFTPGRDLLFRALERTTSHIPDIILSTSERFFDAVGQDAGDLRTGAAAGSTHLAKLVVRAYSGATNESVKSRCLDLIDQMVLLRALGMDDATAEFER